MGQVFVIHTSLDSRESSVTNNFDLFLIFLNNQFSINYSLVLNRFDNCLDPRVRKLGSKSCSPCLLQSLGVQQLEFVTQVCAIWLEIVVQYPLKRMIIFEYLSKYLLISQSIYLWNSPMQLENCIWKSRVHSCAIVLLNFKAETGLGLKIHSFYIGLSISTKV